MSYLALYRKYRPSTFDEIVGQVPVKTALQNQVKYGKIGHAYLFCGTRGTGKTSTAKVFARAVNCLHPVDGNPCNECELCKEAETSFNVVELDAASNNGVDNIRDLREEVQYTPSKGRYKVYIIDEVHMLSSSAFNALLKTLEEPPEHVIFILATTDPQKVLPTIVSRCQRYDFRRITTDEIHQHLVEVCAKENIGADSDALRYIASLADGAMRDALSILDQCHSYYINETLTLSKVQDTLGAVDTSIFAAMTQALAKKDTAALLSGVQRLFDEGKDPLQFVGAWTVFLRDLLVTLALGNRASKLLQDSTSRMEDLTRLASLTDRTSVTRWIEDLSQLEAQLKASTQRRILMEVELIRMSITADSPRPVDQAPVVVPLAAPQTGGGIPAASVPARKEASPSAVARPAERGIPEPAGMSAPVQMTAQVRSDGPASSWWPKLRDNIIGRNGTMRLLSYITVTEGSQPDELVVTSSNNIYLKQLRLNDDEKLRIVKQEIQRMTGKEYRLVLRESNKLSAPNDQDLQNKIHMNIEWR